MNIDDIDIAMILTSKKFVGRRFAVVGIDEKHGNIIVIDMDDSHMKKQKHPAYIFELDGYWPGFGPRRFAY